MARKTGSHAHAPGLGSGAVSPGHTRKRLSRILSKVFTTLRTGPAMRFYNGPILSPVACSCRDAWPWPHRIQFATKPKTSGRRKAVIALAIGAFLLLAHPGAASLVQSEVHQPRQQSGASVFCRTQRPDLLCLRRPDRRSRTQPPQALRRAPAGGGRFEVPHAPGRGQPAAVVPARDCDVLVLLRADEPLDRQMVFPAGRGSARGYRGHVGSALRLRRPECDLGGAIHRPDGRVSKSFRQRRISPTPTEELREHIPTLQGGFVVALARRQRGSQPEHPGSLDRNERSFPVAAGAARRTSSFPVGPDGLHCWRRPRSRQRRCAGRHASAAKICRNGQADSGQPAALHRTGAPKESCFAEPTSDFFCC